MSVWGLVYEQMTLKLNDITEQYTVTYLYKGFVSNVQELITEYWIWKKLHASKNWNYLVSIFVWVDCMCAENMADSLIDMKRERERIAVIRHSSVHNYRFSGIPFRKIAKRPLCSHYQSSLLRMNKWCITNWTVTRHDAWNMENHCSTNRILGCVSAVVQAAITLTHDISLTSEVQFLFTATHGVFTVRYNLTIDLLTGSIIWFYTDNFSVSN
jgi:hypothetical protein